MFDAAYLVSWEQLKLTPGLFRNPCYEATQRRPLGTDTAAVTQFNPEHLKNKRPSGLSPKPSDLRVVRQFDPALFNFTKAKSDEIVAKVLLDASDPEATPTLAWSAKDGDDSSHVAKTDKNVHPFFANISPIMGAHGLFVPEISACNAQVLTPGHLTTALRVMALSKRSDFHLGFNSLAAWASVNHLHFHATYISDAFPEDGRFAVERSATTMLQSAALPASPVPAPSSDDNSSAAESIDYATGDAVLAVEELSGWPLGGFRFSLRYAASPSTAPDASSAPAAAPAAQSEHLSSLPAPPPRHAAALGAAAGAVVAHMTSHDIAHNLLLADRGASVYLLPRAHQTGLGADEGRMAVAFAESCGIGIVYSQQVFESFSEREYVEALAGSRISGQQAEELKRAAVEGVNQAAAAQ